MTFANWLEDHLVSHMLVSKEKWNGRTVRLVEKGVMEVKIEDVPSGAFVIHFDKGDQETLKEKERLFKTGMRFNFDLRCDYLILEESNTTYTATFIELKKNFRDYDSVDEIDLKGEEQLRWSLPGLKYLLAIYEADKHTISHERAIQVRYFLVANHKNPWYRKRTSREIFVTREHEGIKINYMATEKTSMRKLKTRDSVSVLRHKS